MSTEWLVGNKYQCKFLLNFVACLAKYLTIKNIVLKKDIFLPNFLFLLLKLRRQNGIPL
jgi:hypothetical protein